MKRLKALKGPIFWAAYCAVVGVWNFTAGVLAGHWWNYALGALMVALLVFNIREIKQRKAEPAVAKKDTTTTSITLHAGGYVGPSFSTAIRTTPTPPANTAGEFKGLPFDFAVGEVYGLRMWRMDQYGRLRARNWDKAPPWRSGVNEAKCVERADEYLYGQLLHSFSSLYSNSTSSTPKPTPKPPHDTPSEDCACGFYAYTESHHAETLPYKDGHVVLGVIKGTGRTLMGTKGFRCEKAEIIALRDPTRGGTKNDPWRVQQLASLKRVYPDIPLLPSRAALLEFAPLTNTMPEPSTDEFWALP